MALRPSNPSPYWSPEIARQNSLNDYQAGREAIQNRDYGVKPLPQYDYAKQAQHLAQQAANINVQSAQNQVQNAANTQFLGGGGGGNNAIGGVGGQPKLNALLRALRAQESGGNYGVQNGIGAAGAYQIMPANFVGAGGWDQQALGRDIGLDYFLSHPGIQDAIARKIFGGYYNQYGARGALASWYSGQPDWHSDSPQNGGPSIHDYVMQVLSRL